MIPEYVSLNGAVRNVRRHRQQVGTSSGSWWCPFCDNSQVEGYSACGHCGAMVVTKPIVLVTETLPPARDGMEVIRQAEVAGDRVGALSPATPGGVAEEAVARVPSPRAVQLPPPPKTTPRRRSR